MNPVPQPHQPHLPPSAQPTATGMPPALQAAQPQPPRGVSLGLAALLLGTGAALLAAGAAAAAVLLLDTPAIAAAALAAAVGVLLAGVPLALLALKLARAAPADALDPALQPPGLARPLFLDLAEREFARARRYGSGAALLLVDVDRHARLCEARGLAAGDAVLDDLLRQTAPMLRTADLLTRFSDTQMAVFLAHADATGALDVAERIRERAELLEVAYTPPGQPATQLRQPQQLRITVSVGVAHLRPTHLGWRNLVDDADDAVVAARQAGGNCVRAAPVDAAGRLRPQGSGREDRRAKPRQPGGPS